MKDGGRTGATSTTGSSAARDSTGRSVPTVNGGGPSPDNVSVLRDPSTGGTSARSSSSSDPGRRTLRRVVRLLREDTQP